MVLSALVCILNGGGFAYRLATESLAPKTIALLVMSVMSPFVQWQYWRLSVRVRNTFSVEGPGSATVPPENLVT
jgi:hypothetical protein